MNQTNKLSITKNISLEAVGLIFSSLIPGLIWLLGIYSAITIIQMGHPYLVVLLPFTISLAYIFLCFIIRLALPKLKPGTYDLKKDKMVVVWYMHISLSRSLNASGLRTIIRSSNILKYLFYKALGAKIAYTANYSTDLELVDPALITMEKNVIVGGRCFISCHLIYNNKLVLKPIHIKRNAFIQFNNIVGQATTIGESAIIGNGNILYNMEVPNNYKMENFAMKHGTPKQSQRFQNRLDSTIANIEYEHFHKKYGFIKSTMEA